MNQLAHTLHRLETALKEHFQLREMKVPETEYELRWSLNRFLEAASKKHSPARIIIIIDGVHSLKSEGSPDGMLYWLPTELPKYVRFILSTVEHERNPKKNTMKSFNNNITTTNTTNTTSTSDHSKHHTFVELERRECTIERIVPLGVPTCHSVINAFRHLHAQTFQLTEAQQFKIVTANSSTQPMYLRSVLQAIRLASTLTNQSTDSLLETFLNCSTAHELIDVQLDLCCTVMVESAHTNNNNNYNNNSEEIVLEHDENEESLLKELLSDMLSMIHVSRSGLTIDEIWGILRMKRRYEPSLELQDRLLTILKDMTMVVNDMYCFSHEVYREVVYVKYITSSGALTRWHNYLARFFEQLLPCDRKLVALPYHLRIAGKWSKVKNCLTDIEMFQLWWTPKFKPDFIKNWSFLTGKQSNEMNDISNGIGTTSATAIISPITPNGGANAATTMTNNNNGNGNGTGLTSNLTLPTTYDATLNSNNNNNNYSNNDIFAGTVTTLNNNTNNTIVVNGNNNNNNNNNARPTYDIVEEYCKSLDEFTHAKHPTDQQVKEIILKIGDFLLEFAKLGYEMEADVPALVHPKVPNDDLRALGVQYIEIDEEKGTAILRVPYHKKDNGSGIDTNDTKKDDSDAYGEVTAATENASITVYYYSRWMWIHFPYVSLGNSDPKQYEHLAEDFYLSMNNNNSNNNNNNNNNNDQNDIRLPGNINTSGFSPNNLGATTTMTATSTSNGGGGGGGGTSASSPGGFMMTNTSSFNNNNNNNNNMMTNSMSNNDLQHTNSLTHFFSKSSDEIGKMLKRLKRLNTAANNNNNTTTTITTSASTNDLKLPDIFENSQWLADKREKLMIEDRRRGRRAKRTIPRIPPPIPPKVKNPKSPPSELDNELSINNTGKPSQVMIRMLALQDSIQIAREEFDQLVQTVTLKQRKLQTLKDTLVDLQRTAQSCTQYDDSLQEALTRLAEAQKKLFRVLIANQHLVYVHMMCERHPANVPALITELQQKIELDSFIVKEIRKRVWEQRFELQSSQLTFHHMKNLIREGAKMQQDILDCRVKIRSNLQKQAEIDERALLASSSSTTTIISSKKQVAGATATATTTTSNQSKKGGDNGGDEFTTTGATITGGTVTGGERSKKSGKQTNKLMTNLQDELEAMLNPSNIQNGKPAMQQSWEEIREMISSQTGITEPETFFQRVLNA
jgi:hypothetical protein